MIVNGCLIFVLLVTSMAGEVHSDLYVSTDGKDSNAGTIESPLQTVQHAADIAKPGTTTYIRGGVYCQQLTIHSSGNAREGFITFRSQPGEQAILDGGCLKLPEDDTSLIELTNVSFVRVQGLEVRNFRTTDYRSVPWGNTRIRGRFAY